MAHPMNNDLANKKNHLIAQHLILMGASYLKVGCIWLFAMDISISSGFILKTLMLGDIRMSGCQHWLQLADGYSDWSARESQLSLG
jgi:hypothetical protein